MQRYYLEGETFICIYISREEKRRERVGKEIAKGLIIKLERKCERKAFTIQTLSLFLPCFSFYSLLLSGAIQFSFLRFSFSLSIRS